MTATSLSPQATPTMCAMLGTEANSLTDLPSADTLRSFLTSIWVTKIEPSAASQIFSVASAVGSVAKVFTFGSSTAGRAGAGAAGVAGAAAGAPAGGGAAAAWAND